MDSPSRTNGSKTRPSGESQARAAARSRVAGRIEKALESALDGDPAAALSITGAELLADSIPVAAVIGQALDARGAGTGAHFRLHELLRRSRVYDDLLNSLQSPNPLLRAGAARLCGAARIPDSVIWLGDLIDDPSPKVREAAVRSLGQLGGRRAVELLAGAVDRIPLYLLAIALAEAATDMDIEALMRRPVSEHAAVATVMACGLRCDVLRIPPLLGIAHDRRWPKQVRLAACKALAMIGSRSAADGLRRVADTDPDETIKAAATRAHKRLLRRAVQRPA